MADSAAIYLRVSTEDQVDGFSLTEQQERCEAYARSQGWQVAGVYRDEGVSASLSLAERPAGAELLKAAQAGTVSHVVCAKLDRFTRSLVKGTQDLEALDALGVGVSLLDVGVNTSTPAGELVLSVMMAFAQFERKTIAERMSTGRLGRLRDGKWPGGPHPYGFTTDAEGFLVRDEDQAPTVLRIFHLMAQGQGSNAIANLLNAEHVPGPTGNGWTYRTVSEIVGRAAEYASGTMKRTQGPKGKRETHALSVPVLVSEDVAQRASKALKVASDAQQQKRKSHRQRTYALTGHLRHLHGVDVQDPEHSVAMSGRYKRTKLGRYMQCPQGADCPGFSKDHAGQLVRTMPAARLEAGAILWGLALLEDPERLEAWVAAFDRQTMGDAADDSAALSKALKRREAIEARLAEMVKALSRGLVTADTLEQAQREAEHELAECEAAIERLASAAARSDALRMSVAVLRNSGPLLANLMSADVRPPLPSDTGTDADAWPQLRDWLRTEAREVLAGIAGMGVGRPKAGAPSARDLHPAATEWARALVTHFSITLVLTGPEPDDWHVTGSVPAHEGGPGTMKAWQRQSGSQEAVQPQGLSSSTPHAVAPLPPLAVGFTTNMAA